MLLEGRSCLCVLGTVVALSPLLPAPPPAPMRRMEDAERRPLYEAWAVPLAADVEASVGGADGKGGAVFVTTHKAGTWFVYKVAEKLRMQIGNPDFTHLVNLTGARFKTGDSVPEFWRMEFDSYIVPKHPIVVEHASMHWPLPPFARVVHWVRDPVQLILSAYFYHKDRTYEAWNLSPGVCQLCDAHAHAAIFEPCRYSCSYYELLTFAERRTGVVMEALHARQATQNMYYNVKRWMNNRNVLHLSVNHLRANQSATVWCMLRWLGSSDEYVALIGDPEEAPGGGSTLGVPRRHAAEHGGGSRGDAEMTRLLEGHPAWAGQFREIRAALAAIFARQARHHGCPDPAG